MFEAAKENEYFRLYLAHFQIGWGYGAGKKFGEEWDERNVDFLDKVKHLIHKKVDFLDLTIDFYKIGYSSYRSFGNNSSHISFQKLYKEYDFPEVYSTVLCSIPLPIIKKKELQYLVCQSVESYVQHQIWNEWRKSNFSNYFKRFDNVLNQRIPRNASGEINVKGKSEIFFIDNSKSERGLINDFYSKTKTFLERNYFLDYSLVGEFLCERLGEYDYGTGKGRNKKSFSTKYNEISQLIKMK